MSGKNTSSTAVWVLLSVISSSSKLKAEQPNPLTQFSTQEADSAHATSERGCHDKLDENNVERLCESASNDASVFDSKPILAISTQIDVRPESCLSFFDDYLHTRRGIRIESALHTATEFSSYQATVATFPVIDFINTGHAHVVKSKDLSSKFYTKGTSTSPLFDSIMADAIDIKDRILDPIAQQQTITAKFKGESTTLRLRDIRDVSLHIVLQAGLATYSQIEQIRLAEAELEKRWGIKLKIIEIP